jgi:hypothetical protein
VDSATLVAPDCRIAQGRLHRRPQESKNMAYRLAHGRITEFVALIAGDSAKMRGKIAREQDND